MLYLILVDCSLLRAGERYGGLRSVRRMARRRGKSPENVILDSSWLSPSERRLIPEKAGRPDVVHRTLLAATDSPAFREGLVEIFMETLDGRVFGAARGLRPPRTYARFVGLMEQLLEEGEIGPPGRRLMWEIGGDLRGLIERLSPDLVVLAWERGGLCDPADVLDPELDAALLVGAFAVGDFEEDVLELADLKISIYGGSLPSSTVTSILLWEAYRRWRGVVR
ncbi:MAG: 16S rRNA methyltransferase [Thermoproteota archaeon]|nr:MAG: 16S rRNA methyltransferase [Candidatus Korarchaeota archaeon]